MSSAPTFESIRDDFSLLDSWEDRYRYVMELGRALPPLDDALRTDTNKVRGCASQVWLLSQASTGADPVITFQGDSDALIVKGLVALVLALYSGKTASAILAEQPRQLFDEIGLKQHLSPQRSNGLASMVQRIRADAQRALVSGTSYLRRA